MGCRKAAETLEETGARHRRADREAKGAILDEHCEMTGCHRKSAIRVLNGLGKKAAVKRPGPKPVYGAEELAALKEIWLAAEQPCGKRLVHAIALWLPSYERIHTLKKGSGGKLLRMSAAEGGFRPQTTLRWRDRVNDPGL